MRRLERFVDRIWYQKNHPLSMVLAPLGWIYAGVSVARRFVYQSGLAHRQRVRVPVVVVGNITVGGTGKTPLVCWLARYLREQGFKPGIVCRGYRGVARFWPQQVRPDSDPVAVGDESVLLARLSSCPVAAGPDRVQTVHSLLEHEDVDLVISDDGLQHYELERDVEIAVVDGVRRNGNGRCLPAGPLREPPSRLAFVDIVVANEGAGRGEFEMKLLPGELRHVLDASERRTLQSLKGKSVHALCGIGHPNRFFRLLERYGIVLIRHEFPDHYHYAAEDIEFADGLPVLMTEKDAIKCRRFAGPQHWYLPVRAEPHHLLGDRVMALLKRVEHGHKAA